MVQLPRQPTRFERLATALSRSLLGPFQGSWRRRSALLLALLLGFYAGGTVTAYVVVRFPGGRPSFVLALVLLLELVVRLRTRVLPPLPDGQAPPLGWQLADNLRIGLVYAVVLEAFKLGT
ncbi:DUF565 domain-containing protein [Synechococcus sp. FGCU-3]|jgi:dolichol kinase|nr:DUF565 domain-containing protein [Synechococcus sp. FGCU3]